MKLCIIEEKAEAEMADCHEEHLVNFGLNATTIGTLEEKQELEENIRDSTEKCAGSVKEDNEKEGFRLASPAPVCVLQGDNDSSSGKGARLSE